MRRSAGVIAVTVLLAAAGVGTAGVAANSLPSELPVATAVVEAAMDDAGEVSAAASSPAIRIRPLVTAYFPMNPSPRCDVLNNFGDSRSGGRSHEGTDILATLGQEVLAITDGTLTSQTLDGSGGYSGLSGNAWRLTQPDKTYFYYAHLSRFAEGLSVGSFVRAGQVIGYVGDTGNPGAGNYHLHFEVHPQGGAALDPLKVLEIPAGCKVF
jgi:peptidoglycan LD-endopeptidase LytH